MIFELKCNIDPETQKGVIAWIDGLEKIVCDYDKGKLNTSGGQITLRDLIFAITEDGE